MGRAAPTFRYQEPGNANPDKSHHKDHPGTPQLSALPHSAMAGTVPLRYSPRLMALYSYRGILPGVSLLPADGRPQLGPLVTLAKYMYVANNIGVPCSRVSRYSAVSSNTMANSLTQSSLFLSRCFLFLVDSLDALPHPRWSASHWAVSSLVKMCTHGLVTKGPDETNYGSS